MITVHGSFRERRPSRLQIPLAELTITTHQKISGMNAGMKARIRVDPYLPFQQSSQRDTEPYIA